LNSDAFLQKEFFLQCQPVNHQFCIGVLRVFVEAVGRKCPTGGVHRTGFCFITTCHASHIHGFFQCLTKKKKDGVGIWPLYFSILVFMAYSGSPR